MHTRCKNNSFALCLFMNTSQAFIALMKDKELCYKIGIEENYRRYLKARAINLGTVSVKLMTRHLLKAKYICKTEATWSEPQHTI